jgi:hypothetical protein
MGFTPTRLKFNVEKATPTTLEPKNLKTQLNSIGFTCAYTSEPALAQYIDEELGKVTKGSNYLIAILSPGNRLKYALRKHLFIQSRINKCYFNARSTKLTLFAQ